MANTPRVFPGVEAGLIYLKARGLKLACLTNKPTAFARALLQAKGLDGFFDRHVSAATPLRAKSPIRCRCSLPVPRWAQRRGAP